MFIDEQVYMYTPVSLHECVHIYPVCGNKRKHLGATAEEAWRQYAAWYAYATCWYDYSTGCSLCFRLVINNLFEDFVNRCQDNKKQHRPLHAQRPPSQPLAFLFSH